MSYMMGQSFTFTACKCIVELSFSNCLLAWHTVTKAVDIQKGLNRSNSPDLPLLKNVI